MCLQTLKTKADRVLLFLHPTYRHADVAAAYEGQIP